jgi:hypothetical protein
MADDTQHVVPNEPAAFEPEPVPENIADTELNGLKPAESSTDDTQAEDTQEETQQDQPDDAESKDDAAAEAEDNPDTPSEDESDKPEQTVENPDEDPEAARKRHNDEMAQQRIAQKQQRDFINAQRAQIREAEMSADPEDQARRLEILEAKQYVDTVERNRAGLINENAQAQATIDLFNPQSENYNQRLYARALQNFNDNYVITDPETGEVLGAQDRFGNNVSLYQYLSQEAADMRDILGNTQATTQVKAQQAEAKMRARAVNPSNPGKITSSGDELQDLLDKVGDMPLV